MDRTSSIIMATRLSFSWIFCGLTLILCWVPCADGLGCFKCTSTNHDNPGCEDPFLTMGMNYYESDCWGYKLTGGSFPSTKCIKLEVSDKENGYYLMLRDCVPEDGVIDGDKELGRISHCSSLGTGITYNDRRSDGCLEVCFDDGCNKGHGFRPDLLTFWLISAFSLGSMY